MDAQISAAFDRFYELITPPRWQAENALACARAISNHLNNSAGEIASYSFKQYRLVGSYARATAIRKYSDIDFIFEFQSSEALDRLESRPLLAGIRTLLERSEDSAVRISEMQEVVQIEYPSGLRLDILPAMRNDAQSFHIPDGMNGWRVTTPDVQTSYFSGRDTASKINLPEFTRGLKYWNARRGGLIRSYHLESIVAQLGPQLDGDYAIASRETFQRLPSALCITDPVGRQGELSVYLSAAQKAAISALCHASAAEALVALEAQASGHYERALTAWASAYGPRFPDDLLRLRGCKVD